MRLQHKLTATLVSASLVPMVFLGLIAYSNARFGLQEQTMTELQSIADLYKERLENYYARGGSEESLWTIVRDNTGLGSTGEIVIGKMNAEGGSIQLLAASRFQNDASLLEPVPPNSDHLSIYQAAMGKEGIFTYLEDYKKAKVFSATRHIKDLNIGIAVQIQQNEVLAPLYPLKVTLIVMGAIVLGFSMIIAYLTSVSIAKPIQRLTSVAGKIAQGALDTKIGEMESEDEIIALAGAFGTMTEKLKELYEGLEAKVRERTKQLEQALQDVRKFQLAVETSTDAIVITDAQTNIVYVNPAWCELTGYSETELIGLKTNVFKNELTPDEVYEEMREAIRTGGEFHSEDVVNTRKSGEEYFASLTFYPIVNMGQVHFFVGILHDITLRKKEERAKNEFVSLASHQLRTPLTAMRWGMGRLERLLKKRDVTEQESHIFESARKGARNMAETIGTMLTISRIASGKIKIAFEPTDLHGILMDVKEAFVPQCEKEKKFFEVISPMPLNIYSDPKFMREIIMNLVSNAIKYSPEGKTATVSATLSGDTVTLIVQDQGYGIPVSEHKKVFSMFYRSEHVTEKGIEGTGLGLYLVHELVTLLRGTISFHSEKDRGTRFTMTFPVSPQPDEQS